MATLSAAALAVPGSGGATPATAPLQTRSPTEPPFIATCAPTPMGTTVPPGLYPNVSVSDVSIYQPFMEDGCPAAGYLLRICVRNAGQAPAPALKLRIQNCGVGRLELEVPPVDTFAEVCVEVPAQQVPPTGICELMLEPDCEHWWVKHYWTGPVPHPQPRATCTPAPSLTPTATGSGTATATSTPERNDTRVPIGTPVPAFVPAAERRVP